MTLKATMAVNATANEIRGNRPPYSMEMHSFLFLMGLHDNNVLFSIGRATVVVGSLIENMVHGEHSTTNDKIFPVGNVPNHHWSSLSIFLIY